MCDDLFDGVLDFEAKMYEEGVKEGEEEGTQKVRNLSLKEGENYGKDIGNHIGYYQHVISMMEKFRPEKFENSNSRISRITTKLRKLISQLDISNCYEPTFETEMGEIRKNFKQFLSLMKVKGADDDPSKALEF
jgi:hypothetical protein